MTDESTRPDSVARRIAGRLLGAGIVGAAVIAVVVTLLQWEIRPQTDDATVRANFVGIAPQVSGHIVELQVRDNQLVRGSATRRDGADKRGRRLMAERRFDVGMDPEDKSAQRQMWDHWWYDRFEIPHAIPADARRLEMEMGGERFGAVLLDHVAPKTCKAFWDVLPYTGNMIHCAWFGHAAFYLDRVPLLDVLGYELENRFQRLAPGDIVWDPYIEEVTIAYGRNALVNFPTTVYTQDGRQHPNQVCIFGRVVENLDGFAVMCKRLRYEGTKPMTTWRVERRV